MAVPRTRLPVRRGAARVAASAALLLGAAFTVCALAQTPDAAPDIESRSAHWSLLLDLVTAEFDKPEVNHAVIEALRPQIEKMQREAADAADAAAADAEAVRQLLDALGPPPAQGEPPESEAVAAERATLDGHRAEREGRVKQAELISLQARQVLARIAETRRERSARRLLERGPSPLSWDVLASAGPHALGIVRELSDASVEVWFPAAPDGERWIGPRVLFLPALVLTVVLVVPARRWMLRRYVRDRDVETPSFAYRTRAAVLVGVARGALPSFIGLVPLAFLLSVPFERGVADDVLVAAFSVTAGLFLAAGLARAALAPYSPDGWRLAPLTRESARGLYHRTLALAFLVGGLLFIEYPGARHLEVPRELVPFYHLLADCALAGFILLLLPGRLWRHRETAPRAPGKPEPSGRRGPPRLGKMLRIAAAVVAASIPLLSLAGFEALADYLVSSLVESIVVLGLAAIVHGVARDVIALALAGRDAGPAEEDGTVRDGNTMFRFWLVAAADTVLAVVVAVVLLMSWGLGREDLGGWLVAAADGVRIGSFRLSVTDLLFSVLIFAGLLAATRWLQRILETRILPQTRLDAGVRNSLKTTVGYAGLFVAVMAGISTLGIDLSNIAIIAGALSVGIGFGLQNIFNNFISGLILLAERPVKVGDWIVVGEHQGYVQRINVRATEILTFHRSSVIIPNSELLSSAVLNWTHKDPVVRIEIPVGVSYASDVDLVRDVLLDVAASHPEVRHDPAPFVLFTNFGESSLDFDLRCFAHANRAFRIATEMRFEIVRRFRERGIEIPFPQRDVHLHGLDAPAAAGRADGSGGGSDREPGLNRPGDPGG